MTPECHTMFSVCLFFSLSSLLLWTARRDRRCRRFSVGGGARELSAVLSPTGVLHLTGVEANCPGLHGGLGVFRDQEAHHAWGDSQDPPSLRKSSVERGNGGEVARVQTLRVVSHGPDVQGAKPPLRLIRRQ